MPKWAWMGASCRGVSHVKAETRRQDAYSCFATRGGAVLVTILSDGAGSASHGGEGASLVCRTMATSLRRHFCETSDMPDDDTIRCWLDEARDRIGTAADRRGLKPRDFAATMVATISDGADTLVAHVGDGSSVVRETGDGSWHALSWPAQGEYASTTFFVPDEPEPRLQIVRSASGIDAIATFTDGIERLALDYATQTAHPPFFRGIIAPLDGTPEAGLDLDLSGKLKAYLDTAPINDRTDDDKTLVLAVLR